jgi:hypothetical protein
MAAQFASYCTDEGIQRHYPAPYSLQQNDVVERCNQTVVGMARALLKQRGMSAVFWGKAVVTAVYILNRSPTKALDDRMPYAAWHRRKPTVPHLRVFGCLAFAKELGHIDKLDDRSTPGVFIGYAEGSKAYHIFDPKTQRVHTARDVFSGRGWVWDKTVDDGSTPTYVDFTIEYIHFEEAGGSSSPSMSTSVPESPLTPVSATPKTPCSPTTASAAMSPSPTPPLPATPHTPVPTATPPGTSTPAPAHVEHSSMEFASPLSHDEERIVAYYRRRTFSATNRCWDWCHTTWRRSCTLHVKTVSLGPLQRLREMRHGTPRCSWGWMRSSRTTPRSSLTSLVVTARSPLSGCSS